MPIMIKIATREEASKLRHAWVHQDIVIKFRSICKHGGCMSLHGYACMCVQEHMYVSECMISC